MWRSTVLGVRYGNAPDPGCCFIINGNGKVLASFRGNHINGPWGATSSKNGIYIYIYYDNSHKLFICICCNTLCRNILTHCLLSLPHRYLYISICWSTADGSITIWMSNVLTTNNGYIARYMLRLPKDNDHWESGTSDSILGSLGEATILVSGIESQPETGGIQIGAVGPSGLAYDSKHDRLYYCDTMGNGIFYIEHAKGCTSDCVTKQFVNCPGNGECNRPRGLNFIRTPLKKYEHDLIVANGADANLVQYNIETGFVANKTILVTIDGDTDPASGFLYNALTVPVDGDHVRVAYNDAHFNTIFFLDSFKAK
jgi:hypothetical protein